MIAYELYWFDKTEKPHFVGLIHEKRKNLLRITRESVLTLGRKVIGRNEESRNIYFIQVEMQQPR